MSQPANQPIPSGSYWQEYHTIIINTPISGPIPTNISDGESCPPFIEPSFIQGSSPASTTSKFSWVSNPPPIPSPINLIHQEELFKWFQDLPPQGYPTSTMNPDKWPKVWLLKTEPVSMYELHNMLNDPDQQNIFIDAINLIGNECNLLSCWWHFDHCINMAIRLKTEAETQWMTAKNLFRRLQLLKIDEKLRPIIVMEKGWILQQMRDDSNPLAQEPSEVSEAKSEPVPPLEFIYYQQSWLTSPATPITMFNLEESFITAPSTPEQPAPPTDDPPLLPIPPPSTLQVPPFDYHHGQPCHYQHHPEPTYVAGSSSEESDGSPRYSALSLQSSPINDEHDEHHMNKRDAHFRKYGLELPSWDIHLHQIWNLWTRMRVMLWSLILLGTGMISLSWTLFLFSTALCASFITFLCHCA